MMEAAVNRIKDVLSALSEAFGRWAERACADERGSARTPDLFQLRK
ncbi:MAG: hypothetical protein AAFR16_07915 [Pseudomonadota bacterium]